MQKDNTQNIKTSLLTKFNVFIIIKGILLSYILTIPLFMLFAFILTCTDFPEKYIYPVVILSTVISIFFSGTVTTKKMRSKGFINGGAVGFMYMLILYLVGSIISKDFSIDGSMLSMSIIGMLAGSIGGIIGINTKHKSHNKITVLKKKT